MHLESLVDIRAHNLSQPTLGYNNTNDLNPLMSYPKPYEMGIFDSIEGTSSGLALLRIGVAVAQYVDDHSVLPSSLKVLVPEYLTHLPGNRTGAEFTCNTAKGRLEIVSPEVPRQASRRALRFELEVLIAGIREDLDPTTGTVTENTATQGLAH